MKYRLLLASLFLSGGSLVSQVQDTTIDPKLTEFYSPVPKVVTPGASNSEAPNDAIILFDGKNLDQWVTMKDSSAAKWTVEDGYFTVKKGTGNIRTKQSFSDYQLHIEWRIPQNITGTGQGRGNSGIFLSSNGPGDSGYELQTLDSYNNPTYVNGQAGSIYKQTAPLVNANKPPGVWQSYDIIWKAPVFNKKGKIQTPARATIFMNGVLVQNYTEVKGGTVYRGKPSYIPHGPGPIKLQDHGDKSEPLSFRNIWIRPL